MLRPVANVLLSWAHKMPLKKPDNLVKVYEGMIVPDQALLLPLYSREGELLAQKGTVLDERQAIVILRFGDIYTIRSELIEAVKGGYGSVVEEDDVVRYRFPAVFEQLELLSKAIKVLFTKEPPAFLKEFEVLLERFKGIVNRQSEACLAYVVLNQHKDMHHHGLCCAIICHAITEKLEWSEEERERIVSAALTMDGFLMSMSGEEWVFGNDEYMDHQRMGRDLLRGFGVEDEGWLDYVGNHHCESEDDKTKPSWGASILFMADTFCSRLSGVYHQEILRSHEVLGFLRGAFNSAMERLSFDALVSAVGVYPLGSIVLLASGEVAVVTELTHHLERPVVRAIYAKDGTRWQTPIIRKTESANFSIREVLPREHFIDIIDLHQFW